MPASAAASLLRLALHLKYKKHYAVVNLVPLFQKRTLYQLQCRTKNIVASGGSTPGEGANKPDPPTHGHSQMLYAYAQNHT